MRQDPHSLRLADSDRLSAVYSALSVDSIDQRTFQRLALMAARTLRAPVAQVNLITDDRQVAVSSVGPDRWEGPREVGLDSSYCQHVVSSGEPLVIENAREHALVRESPATHEAGIVAYAAVPIVVSGDLILGTLCVVDFEVRSWTREEIDLLEHLAEFTANEFQRRGRAEEELFRLASVIDSSLDAVFTCTLAGEITSWNPAAEELFGYPQGEVLGRSRLILVPPDEHESMREIFNRVRQGESVRRDAKRLRRDGSVFWVSICDAPLRDLAGRVTGMAVIKKDITGRREAEMELQKREAHFRSLIENALDIISVVNAAGVIQYHSPAINRVLGYSPEELIGDPIFPYVHPEDLPGMQERFAEMLERPLEPVAYEVRFRHKSGEWRVLRGTGVNLLGDPSVAGLVANSHDVTEIVQTEQALRESEAQYRRLVELSPDAVVVHRDEKIIYTNSAAVQLVGAEGGAQVLGRSIADFIHPDSWGLAQRRLEQIRETGEASPPFELRFTRFDGSARYGEVVAAPVVFEGETAVMVMIRDLTERMTAAAALAQSESQLRQAQKMEAVGQLTGGIAHDFNNLMNAILGNAHFVLADLPPESPLREDVVQIEDAANRAASLTRQLLAFSRQQVLQPEIVDLNGVVSEMTRMLPRVLGETIDLAMNLDPELDAVEVDPTQMHQVILNLCVNARDAMPSGGKLTVETQNVNLDETHTSVRGHRIDPGSYAMLAVSDTGVGIPREIQELIFDPFFTTKEIGKGTGLGLSTTYGIVKQSGGYIWVYSEEGLGTTFKIYLPRVGPNAPAEMSPETFYTYTPVSGTVLLVEDNETVRRIACKTLKRAGHEVLEVGLPEEALRLFAENSSGIDLLLTDIAMPQMSGTQLADRVRAIRPGIPVLFMSGYADEAVVRHGTLAADASFLQKPFSPAALLRAVEQMLVPEEV